jgi:leucyl aminopeptidase
LRRVESNNIRRFLEEGRIMDFRFTALPEGGVSGLNADALLVLIHSDAALQALPGAVGDGARAAAKQGDFACKAGRALYLHQVPGVKAARVVLAALGDSTPKAFKAALGPALASLKTSGARHLCITAVGADCTGEHAQALVAAVADASYVYRHTKPSAAAAPGWNKVSLAAPKAQEAALKEGLRVGQAVAEGVTLAREWANRPGNHCTPTHLAKEAQALAKAHGFKVQVLDRPQIAKLGMGSFLSVAQGSEEPVKFIVIQYQGGGAKEAPVVLVGKGITFDTGGISLKPGGEMDEMKYDMGGAASVLGTFKAVASLKAKVNLVGLIPSCENMPSGKAVKPGDVVTSMSGQTIEILNTDAEGRLILCDALTYAERFKPAAVVDIATLTGACVIALGGVRSGMFSTDDGLADELHRAGQNALDPCWRMPLDDEYAEGLKSHYADVANIAGRQAGAVTAAMFLKRFTSAYPWAHLDIAGTAWRSGAAKGGTGRPVGLLTHFVLGRAK